MVLKTCERIFLPPRKWIFVQSVERRAEGEKIQEVKVSKDKSQEYTAEKIAYNCVNVKSNGENFEKSRLLLVGGIS